jgi:hypothetical protein
MTTEPRHRPFPVTILAILALIAAVLAGLHFLQALGILPYVIGPVSIRDFNLWYVLMWGLMVYVWIWVFRMLWRVERAAWMFLVIVTIFNLMLNFFAILGSNTSFSDVGLSFLVNAAILIYCLLPGTKAAFGMERA